MRVFLLHSGQNLLHLTQVAAFRLRRIRQAPRAQRTGFNMAKKLSRFRQRFLTQVTDSAATASAAPKGKKNRPTRELRRRSDLDDGEQHQPVAARRVSTKGTSSLRGQPWMRQTRRRVSRRPGGSGISGSAASTVKACCRCATIRSILQPLTAKCLAKMSADEAHDQPKPKEPATIATTAWISNAVVRPATSSWANWKARRS